MCKFVFFRKPNISLPIIISLFCTDSRSRVPKIRSLISSDSVVNSFSLAGREVFAKFFVFLGLLVGRGNQCRNIFKILLHCANKIDYTCK